MRDKLHDCKRGLAKATSEDYNAWWRERKGLRAEVAELQQEVRDLANELQHIGCDDCDGWGQ